MLSVRCLSCLSVLSVTLLYCRQTVGRMKMKLGTQVGLVPGNIVLDGVPAPPPPKGHSLPPIFGPYLLRSNGCMDQDVTWYEARPRPRRLCVRWRPRSPSPKGGGAPLQIFGPCLLRPNGLRDEAGTWYGGRPHPRRVCVRWGPSRPPQKGGAAPSPILRVDVRISKLDRKCGALPVVASFVALEQQIILVKTINESVYKWRRYNRLNVDALRD